MLQNLKTSRKYAVALFEAAQKTKAIKAVTKDLTCFKEAWDQSFELIEFINSPVHNNNAKVQLFEKISKKLHLHSNTKHLLSILAVNSRLDLLVPVIENYFELCRDADNEKLVKIISAHKLTSAQNTEIKKCLEQRLNKKIILQNIIDESILGGIVIKIDSFVIDNSTSNKLNNMQLLINQKFTLA